MSTVISSTTPTPNTLPVTSGSSDPAQKSNLKLSPTDFLNLMITQLEHQDPQKPTSSSDLLSQMSQIGQLQSTTDLQSSLKNFSLQTSISSASSMIGKNVQGLNSNSQPVKGIVNSVQVQNGSVALDLDNGQSMPLSSVTSISPGPTGTTAATTPPAQ